MFHFEKLNILKKGFSSHSACMCSVHSVRVFCWEKMKNYHFKRQNTFRMENPVKKVLFLWNSCTFKHFSCSNGTVPLLTKYILSLLRGNFFFFLILSFFRSIYVFLIYLITSCDSHVVTIHMLWSYIKNHSSIYVCLQQYNDNGDKHLFRFIV